MPACSGPHLLFDGHSLAGWSVLGDSRWQVADGRLVASGGDGFLLSDGEFGDFYLRVEFRVDPGTNSGVFIRCRDRSRVNPATCYELNIWDRHPRPELRTGAIVNHVAPPLARVDTLAGWNRLEVTARGRLLRVEVNGVTTALLEDADPTPGFVALQRWEQGEVGFRSVELWPR